MSSTARGSRLTNSSSPSGSSGSPISSAAARARESKEKRASWASAAAISSAPRTSVAPSLPRISASRPYARAVGEVDDRLEVRRHDAVREELGEPVGARAVEQRVGRDRQALLVVEADGEQAGALGVRDRVQQLLEAILPAGAGELHALDGDVAVHGLGRQVLDLVEHGRAVRQQSHALSGLGCPPDPGSSRAASAGNASAPLDLHVEDGALAGDLDRPRRRSPRPRGAPSRRPARRRSGSAGRRRAPARRACSPASPGVTWPRRPSRSGRGSVASMISRSVPRANSTMRVGRGVVGAVGDAPAAVGGGDLDRVGRQ